MLSHSCQYALRAIIFVSEKGSEANKLRSRDISTDLEIPTPFLSKILKQLSRDGLVTSSKGPGGGFYLTPEQKDTKIIDIISCTDQLEKFNQCFLGLPDCSDSNPCSVHAMTTEYRKQLLSYFTSKSVKDLADESAKGISHLV